MIIGKIKSLFTYTPKFKVGDVVISNDCEFPNTNIGYEKIITMVGKYNYQYRYLNASSLFERPLYEFDIYHQVVPHP